MPISQYPPRQQTCIKCGWKSDAIQYSDVCFKWVDSCPKCGGKVEFRKVDNGFLRLIFPFLKK
ncbi:hypothetical protein [Pasteurella sp. PK-2025]|uniref:hypothetical protein n=1 Tax=Pasteurella sp. PK-2025 TaxID=3413133 RepID=UPI003C757C38